MGILAPFKSDGKTAGRVSKKLQNLNKEIKEFLKIYDDDGNEEIDIEELKTKRNELAKDLDEKENSKIKKIIDGMEELEGEIISYRKLSYKLYRYEDNKEKDNLKNDDSEYQKEKLQSTTTDLDK